MEAMHSSRAWTLLVLVPALAAAADYTFTNIADDRPGTGLDIGATIPVVMNANGEVAFPAMRLGANGAPVSTVILAGSGGPLRTIVDSLNQFRAVSPLSINSSGTVLFYGLTDVRPGLYTSTGGVVTPIALDANDLVGPSSGIINDAGVIAYGAGNRITVVTNGVRRLVNTNGIHSFANMGQLNSGGTLALVSLVNGVRKLLKDTGGTIAEVASQGPDFNTSLLQQPAMNDSGVIAIAGSVGATGNGTPAVLRFDGTTLTVLTRGSVAYTGVNVNNSGTVTFAKIATGVNTRFEGIYVGSDSPDGKVIAVGDTLFGSRVTQLSGSGLVTGRYLNDRGQIAFRYSLANGIVGVAVATPAAAARPVLQEGSAVNGASYLPGLVGGSWAQVKGTDLSATTRTWGDADFTRPGALPTALDGVEVKVNGTSAAVYFISPEQISFQMPNGITGNATVQVIRNGVASNTVNGTGVTTAPGLFAYALGGKTYPAAVYANTRIVVGDPALAGAAVRKARPGDRVALYATGLAPSPAGVLPGATNFAGVTATIGTTPATVEFAGLVAVGQFQINILVPDVPDGEHTLVVRYNGEASQPGIVFPVGAP